jgi:hypothetical protein
MASSYSPSREGEHEHHEHHHRPCPDCDPDDLDGLTCEAEGVKARAAYTAAHEEDATKRRTAFDGARKAYSDARTAAADDVKQIRHQLHRILVQLRCQLPDDIKRCLDRSWEEVYERLEACGVPRGCCIDDDCEFDTHCEGVSTEELRARQAEIERRVMAAERCFDDLIKEPAALVARVAKLKQDVDALATAAADPATPDPRNAYATALWVRQRLHDIWLGFEHANAYHECLCGGLICSLRGRTALAVLAGEFAVRQCREDERTKRCQWLRDQVVDEILAVSLRICPPSVASEDQPAGTATA